MKIRSRFLTRLIAWFAVRTFRLLCLTCRKVVYTEKPNINPYEGTGENRYLYSIWHDQIVMTLFTHRPREMSGLVSRHRDGIYVTAAMDYQGIEPVRGSSGKGGVHALRALLDKVHERHVAITPDGPRGPRRKAKAGIVYLAARTGRKIVPVAYTCKRLWLLRGSWTELMVPKPFTTIYYTSLEPMAVPADLDRAGVEEHVWRLQEEMQRAEDLVHRLAAGELQPGEGPAPVAEKENGDTCDGTAAAA